jgi:hypothetical protein
MNPATEIFGAFLIPKDSAIAGLQNGILHRVGSVVRWASGPMKGKIHSHLQETGLYEQLAGASLKLVDRI